MTIEDLYYKIDHKARDFCLNCPLAECVYMPNAQDGDSCPIDGFTVGPATVDNFEIWRKQKLLEIKAVVDEIDFPSASRVARKTGIAQATVRRWGRLGYLEIKKVQSPYGRGKLQAIISVNV